MAMKWFLDSWAVVDGKAFASHREPEAPSSTIPRRKASVFLAAPYFEPEWTTRPSTALAAWRLGFQPGLRDSTGDEIEFQTLEEIRELVRRGYMGSGGGGLGPFGVVVDQDGPEPPMPDGADAEPPSSELLSRGRTIIQKQVLVRTDRQDLANALFLVNTQSTDALIRFVSDSLFLLLANPQPAPVTMALVRRWRTVVDRWSRLLLILTGDFDVLWELLRQAMDLGGPLANELRHQINFRRWHYRELGGWNWPGSVLFAESESFQPALDLPRWLRVPKRWRKGLSAEIVGDSVVSLGDLACVAMASHSSALEALTLGAVFVPTLAAALSMILIAPLATDLTHLFDDGHLQSRSQKHREELLRAAAHWLAFNLPDAALAGNTSASAALDEMIRERISRHHR